MKTLFFWAVQEAWAGVVICTIIISNPRVLNLRQPPSPSHVAKHAQSENRGNGLADLVEAGKAEDLKAEYALCITFYGRHRLTYSNIGITRSIFYEMKPMKMLSSLVGAN